MMDRGMTLIGPDVTSEQGFTLIEIVVFIVVLGFLSAVLIPMTVSLRGSPQAPITQKAVALAQAELEQAVAQKRASGFAAVAVGNPVGAGCFTPMLPGFTCSRAVCYVPAGNLNDTSACTTTATNYKRVQATINHTAVGNVVAVTLLTNY